MTHAYPNLIDVYEAVRTSDRANHAAREAILDRLASLLVAMTPACAALRRGWDPVDLAKHHIVFELRGSSESLKGIVMSHLLGSVFQHEIENGQPNASVKHWICIEDAQRLLQSGGPSDTTEISPVEEYLQLVRGAAIGLCFNVQSPASIPLGIRANLATKIMGRLGTHADIQSLGADIGLSQHQRQWAKLNLKPGLFIGQTGAASWRHPFLMHIPLLTVPHKVDDHEAAASQQALDALPIITADEYSDWEPWPTVTIHTEPAPVPAEKPEAPAVAPPAANDLSTPAWPPLDDAEVRFLRAVIAQPGLPSSRYAKLARVSTRRAAKARIRLTQLGALRTHEIATGKRGRKALVIEVLPFAHDLLKHVEGGGTL